METCTKPTSLSTTMKKSNSFSFSQLAVAATASSSGSSKGPPKLDLAKLTSQLKDSTKKTSTDDSFKRWEELRAKKLEALNLKPKKKASSEKRKEKKEEILVKYNHQESIQPPPLKPRSNTQQQSTIASHKSSRQRERAVVSASSASTHRRPKISLHPNWYTENIYTNQSMDDSDCDSTVLKRPLTTSTSFSHYRTRSSNRHNQYRNSFHNYDFNGNNRTNNININISNMANTKLQHGHHYSSSFEDDNFDVDVPHHFERRGNYPKSQSCSFAERHREAIHIDARSRSVPKSHSFTG
jgi:hypothetical protein